MLKSYKFRLYPTEEQKVLLAKHFGCVRWVYNYGLAAKTAAYQKKEKLSCFDLANKLGELKKATETEWLKEVNAQSLQMAFRNLDNAYQRFFREKKGFPKFKSKNDNHQSFQCPQRCYLENKKLIIPKFKEGIKIVQDRQFEGQIKTVTISKNPSNKYFTSILVDDGEELPKKKEIKEETSVGIDLGLAHFCTISNGEKIENPRFLEKELKKLAFLQKKFAKKVKGGKNREKLRIKIARLYERITNKRQDFLHKLTSKLINDNQIDTFCLEDLNVAGMLKNRSLARGISDVSWSSFVRYLEYKAEWNGKNILKIGRFEPSSKMCCNCGNIKKDLTLADRTYKCNVCSLEMCRDEMAAKNIMKFALISPKVLGKDVASKPVESSRAKGSNTKKLRYNVVKPQRDEEAGTVIREGNNLGKPRG